MGSKHSSELFDYDDQFIYQLKGRINIFSPNTRKTKTVIHLERYSRTDIYFKCLDDHRMIVFYQSVDNHLMPFSQSIQFELNVYDKNFEVIHKQCASIWANNCVNPILGPMSVSEKKKSIYTYNFHPYFLRIDYQNKIEMKIENKLTSDLPYIDRHVPYENMHPNLRERTAGLGIPIIALPDHCIYIERSEKHFLLNGNKLLIYGNCWKIYNLQEDGMIHNVYYDKYDKMLIILYSTDERYGLELCRLEDDRWRNERIIVLDIGVRSYDITDIVASRLHFAIHHKPILDSNVIDVIDKHGKLISSFSGQNANSYDKYNEWMENRMNFLKEIAVLKKMNVELLKIILLYV